MGENKTRKTQKTLFFGSIWNSYARVLLFIHWQINLDERKWFKAITAFSIYLPSLIIA